MFRLQNRRLYIELHAQENLVGLIAEWEDRLTIRALGVQNTLNIYLVLLPFPAAVAAPQGDKLHCCTANGW